VQPPPNVPARGPRHRWSPVYDEAARPGRREQGRPCAPRRHAARPGRGL